MVPVIDDDGFIVAESSALLLYLAEKAGKLIPPDFQGRTHVIQWCFAALTTVERPLMEIQLIAKFGGGEGAESRRQDRSHRSVPTAEGLLCAGSRAAGLAAHPQPLRRAARRDRRGHSLRLRM